MCCRMGSGGAQGAVRRVAGGDKEPAGRAAVVSAGSGGRLLHARCNLLPARVSDTILSLSEQWIGVVLQDGKRRSSRRCTTRGARRRKGGGGRSGAEHRHRRAAPACQMQPACCLPAQDPCLHESSSCKFSTTLLRVITVRNVNYRNLP